MQFPGYFLIVADFIRWAKSQGIPVGPGRGSGAGSVVAWALTITDLDPIRLNLLFERFLNPERVSMPDFDVDFCQERRDEVIRYVQDRYGHDRVAQIITFGKLQARAVLRDVGRVLQMPYGQVDRLCKLVPNNPAHPVTLEQAIAVEPRLQQARDAEESVATLLDIGLRLEGLYRHASTHAAGLVIGDRPLDELVPLYRDPRSNMPVTQFNMKWVEPAGLVKFDFLGLKTLTVIDRAQRMLAEVGIAFDPAHLPLDDRPTYALLASGDTGGVFQFEGSGMRDVMRRMKPDAFGDVIAAVALFRPGPMDNIPKFIACKHGLEEPDYLHPWLEPVLTETYGVIVYQEQVMQIAQVLSGYSLGEADLLRRAMGKKIRSEMAQQKERFVEGAVAKGVDRGQASGIFELVAKFAEYGFNKSHAAAYALVAYQTAYLKANRPLHFMAASMSLDIGNTDKLAMQRQECRRLGLRLDPPDVNRSEVEFAVVDDGIAYALGAVRNVGRHAAESIVAERRRNGPYRNVWDFAERLDPRSVNRRALENLVRSGAFDALEPNRARLLAGLDTMVAYANIAAEARESQQTSLFGGDGAGGLARPDLAVVPDWPPAERLKQEFDAVGFFLSSHPLEEYSAILKRLRVILHGELAAKLATVGGVVRARLAGAVVARQDRRSQRGNPYAFVRLTDPSGEYEATVFAEVLSASRDLLQVGRSVVLTIDAELVEDQPKLRVQGVEALEPLAAEAAAGLRILLGDPLDVAPLQASLPKGGKGAVSLLVMADRGQHEVEIQLPGGYRVTPDVRAALKAVPGVLAVEEV
jgi:DNA polymerase-3 subunit alpha